MFDNILIKIKFTNNFWQIHISNKQIAMFGLFILNKFLINLVWLIKLKLFFENFWSINFLQKKIWFIKYKHFWFCLVWKNKQLFNFVCFMFEIQTFFRFFQLEVRIIQKLRTFLVRTATLLLIIHHVLIRIVRDFRVAHLVMFRIRYNWWGIPRIAWNS